MAAGGTAESWTPYHQAEAQSARTFALVGLVFYIIGAVVGGIILVTGLVTVRFFPVGMPFGSQLFALIFGGTFIGIAAGLTVWCWLTLQQIETGRYQEAQAPTLVLGILGLIFAGVIGGIFLIIAYAKLSNVTSPQPMAPAMVAPLAAATPQPAGRVCPNCGRPIPMDSKFCNHCGHELP